MYQVKNREVKFIDLGLRDYKEVWEMQEQLFSDTVKIKVDNRKQDTSYQKQTPNYLIFCEHPHVYTIGRNGSESNLLIDQIQLKKRHAGFYRINRGGDITYHGPGQIVGYPILDLEVFGLKIKQYITGLEESVIRTLGNFGLKGERLTNGTGVWLDSEIKNKSRKICAIGVRASRFVTMHGFAFNIGNDLSYFNQINPCGFADKGVTSLEKEIGIKPDMNEVKDLLKRNIADVFSMQLVN